MACSMCWTSRRLACIRGTTRVCWLRLHKLRDLGNTLIVVEHDREVIEGSDYVCDFGPGAGKHGGEVVAQGTPTQLARCRSSLTGPYLSGKRAIPIPSNRRMRLVTPVAPRAKRRRRSTASDRSDHESATWQSPGNEWLEIVGARHNNLHDVRVRIPLGTLTSITGPSGSGKSSLIDDVLYQALARACTERARFPARMTRLKGSSISTK